MFKFGVFVTASPPPPPTTGTVSAVSTMERHVGLASHAMNKPEQAATKHSATGVGVVMVVRVLLVLAVLLLVALVATVAVDEPDAVDDVNADVDAEVVPMVVVVMMVGCFGVLGFGVVVVVVAVAGVPLPKQASLQFPQKLAM
jgi:hypothetical protein